MRSVQLGQLRVVAALALSVGMALALTGAFGLESRAAAPKGNPKPGTPKPAPKGTPTDPKPGTPKPAPKRVAEDDLDDAPAPKPDAKAAPKGDAKKAAAESCFGDLSKVKSVVFIADRSGFVEPMSDFVKTELAKAVMGLAATQQFDVLWFSEGDLLRANKEMVPATEANKQKLIAHLAEVRFVGSTLPVAAMVAALAAKPDLIVIITDGNFEPEFVDLVTTKNAGKCKIDTIGFVLPGGEGHTNLVKLAKKNGGAFRAIDPRTLAETPPAPK